MVQMLCCIQCKRSPGYSKTRKIDFSLLDIRLPDMSGIDLCSEIKSLDQSIVNIIMTGFPSFKSAVDSIRGGAYDYLVKPFRIEQVLSIINNFDKTKIVKVQIIIETMK